eukprot:m51a1_g7545 putative C-tail anchored protein, ubiquitin-conjugating enzyme (217) ;mRNA; r:76294-77250
MAAKPTAVCVARLTKEYRNLLKEKVPNVEAVPDPDNILEWHYVIHGPPSTPYEGGHYHGLLKFSPEYPHKPPAIVMLTPNGRFEVDMRLCLSMSDYHPETWNPIWSVSSILIGLVSFMTEESAALGSLSRSSRERRQLAAGSLAYNVASSAKFRQLFPHLAELHEARRAAQAQAGAPDAAAGAPGTASRASRMCAAALLICISSVGTGVLAWAAAQ